MKPLLTLSLAVLLLVSPASALRMVQKVTSESTAESGTTVRVKKDIDGSLAFTVTRYLPQPQFTAGQPKVQPTTEQPVAGEPKAAQPAPDFHWISDGTANLEVISKNGPLCKTRVAAEQSKDTVVYKFSLARECITLSRFTLTESPDPHFATIYTIDLPEIVEKAFKAPLHP